jgi:CBS domain-containing protein
MFSIYGQAGRVFSGSLEQLRRVRQVGQVERVGRVAALRDAELDFLPAEAGAGPTAEAAGRGQPSAHLAAQRGALGAYAQTGQSTRHSLHRVAELMSQPALTLSASLTAREAWRLLAERGLSQAPVTNAQGQLVGMLLRAELAPGPDLEGGGHWQQAVQQLMRSPVPAVAADTDLRRLAQVLLDTALPGLPVVDDAGAVLGFVSRSDILRALTRNPPLDMWA